jgi:hypothetical protein
VLLTTRETEVVLDTVPLVPVMVSGKVPVGVVVAVVTDSVDVLAVVEAGLNDPAAPAGRPLTENATDPAKPPVRVTVTVYEVLAPGTTVCEDGDADSE